MRTCSKDVKSIRGRPGLTIDDPVNQLQISGALLAAGLLIPVSIPPDPPAAELPAAFKMQASLTLERPHFNTRVGCFERMEISVPLSASYTNPFDPAEVSLDADFRSPTGRRSGVAGYFSVPCRRSLENGRETVEPAGGPEWHVRFTPTEPGVWTVRFTVRDHTGRVQTPPLPFTVRASRARGFARRSPVSPWHLQWDNGSSFFPLGFNLAWSGDQGTFDYDRWFKRLAESGGNCARIWMTHFHLGLELSPGEGLPSPSGIHYGPGAYSLDNAWRLDTILEAAERHGIAVILRLGSPAELRTAGGDPRETGWLDSAYNAVNGGPCRSPQDFWSSTAARRLYQRRLHYLTARYSGYTSLAAWEFWDEGSQANSWFQEMARTLRQADAAKHLITTSSVQAPVRALAEVDLCSSRLFGDGSGPTDFTAGLVTEVEAALETTAKPQLTGEFGISAEKSDREYDPAGSGRNLHNGLWAAALSGSAGGGMAWWWSDYVEPKGLFTQLRGLSGFATTIPWAQRRWAHLQHEPLGSNLRVCGLTTSDQACLWIQNRDSNWQNAREGRSYPPVQPSEIVIQKMTDGEYGIEWWDTTKGKVFSRSRAQCRGGHITLPTPTLTTDVACRLVKK